MVSYGSYFIILMSNVYSEDTSEAVAPSHLSMETKRIFTSKEPNSSYNDWRNQKHYTLQVPVSLHWQEEFGDNQSLMKMSKAHAWDSAESFYNIQICSGILVVIFVILGPNKTDFLLGSQKV